MRQANYIALALTLILLFSACGTIAQTAAAESTQAVSAENAPTAAVTDTPAESVVIDESFENEAGDVKIHIKPDSAPSYPESVQSLSVEKHEISGDEVKTAAEALFGGAEIYKGYEWLMPTGSAAEEKLALWRKLAEDETLIDASFGENGPRQLAEINKRLDDMEAQGLASQPYAELSPCDWTYHAARDYYASADEIISSSANWDMILACTELDGIEYQIYAAPGEIRAYVESIYASPCDIERNYMLRQLYSDSAASDSQVEAVHGEAESVMDAMGLDNWKITECAAVKYDYSDGYFISVVALPCYDGAPMFASLKWEDNSESRLSFNYSNDGRLIEMGLTNPYDTAPDSSEAAVLISLDEALTAVDEYFRSAGKESYSAVVYAMYDATVEVEIDGLEFGYVRAEDTGEGVCALIPALNVRGGYKVLAKGVEDDIADESDNISLTAVNLTDGSIIRTSAIMYEE